MHLFYLRTGSPLALMDFQSIIKKDIPLIRLPVVSTTGKEPLIEINGSLIKGMNTSVYFRTGSPLGLMDF